MNFGDKSKKMEAASWFSSQDSQEDDYSNVDDDDLIALGEDATSYNEHQSFHKRIRGKYVICKLIRGGGSHI